MDKIASITARLDKVANEIEKHDPKMAYAIDQISDRLEGRVAVWPFKSKKENKWIEISKLWGGSEKDSDKAKKMIREMGKEEKEEFSKWRESLKFKVKKTDMRDIKKYLPSDAKFCSSETSGYGGYPPILGKHEDAYFQVNPNHWVYITKELNGKYRYTQDKDKNFPSAFEGWVLSESDIINLLKDGKFPFFKGYTDFNKYLKGLK